MRTARQPDGANQIGEFGELAAGGRVPRVHRVPGRQDQYQAAGAGQVQRLDDEVIVNEPSDFAFDAGFGARGMPGTGSCDGVATRSGRHCGVSDELGIH